MMGLSAGMRTWIAPRANDLGGGDWRVLRDGTGLERVTPADWGCARSRSRALRVEA